MLDRFDLKHASGKSQPHCLPEVMVVLEIEKWIDHGEVLSRAFVFALQTLLVRGRLETPRNATSTRIQIENISVIGRRPPGYVESASIRLLGALISAI